MMFFTIILVLLLLLILISMLNPLQFFALKLVTKEHYSEHHLILPAFLTLMIWFMAFNIMVNIISNITGMSFFDAISASLFNTSNLSQYIPNLIVPAIITIIVSLLLQSLSLLTVNIDYTMLKNKLRFFVNNKTEPLKKRVNSDEYSEMICGENITGEKQNQIRQVDERYKLDYINAFVCSLFIFSLLFFLGILLLFIGSSIGRKVI